MEYSSLVNALKIVFKARTEVGKEDGSEFTSPAYLLLWHAESHLRKQADTALRGE